MVNIDIFQVLEKVLDVMSEAPAVAEFVMDFEAGKSYMYFQTRQLRRHTHNIHAYSQGEQLT